MARKCHYFFGSHSLLHHVNKKPGVSQKRRNSDSMRCNNLYCWPNDQYLFGYCRSRNTFYWVFYSGIQNAFRYERIINWSVMSILPAFYWLGKAGFLTTNSKQYRSKQSLKTGGQISPDYTKMNLI